MMMAPSSYYIYYIICILLSFVIQDISCVKLLYSMSSSCHPTDRIQVLSSVLQSLATVRSSNNVPPIATQVTQDDNLSVKTQFATSILAGSSCMIEDMWLKEVSVGVLSHSCFNVQGGKRGVDALLLSFKEQQEECINAVAVDSSVDIPAPVLDTQLDKPWIQTREDIPVVDKEETEENAILPVRGTRQVTTETATPNDFLFGSQWSLINSNDYGLQAESLWWYTQGGKGSVNEQPNNTVGSIDFGYLREHPDMKDKWFVNAHDPCGNGVDDDGNGLIDDCSGWSFRNNSGDISVISGATDQWHGTATSSLIGAATHNGSGMAAVGAKLRVVPVSVPPFVSGVIQAINYLKSLGVRVINMSLAGNVACDLNVTGCSAYPGQYSKELKNVVSVGAIDEGGDMASFSNYGIDKTSVFAPGDSIVVAANEGNSNVFGWRISSGTSYSSPMTAGVAAMVWREYPQLTSCQIRKVLVDSCAKNEKLSGKTECEGQVHPLRALVFGWLEVVSPSNDYCGTADPGYVYGGMLRYLLGAALSPRISLFIISYFSGGSLLPGGLSFD
eukprot:GHVQ01019022.1.p1 GENE.GHVQ01019022.1~~GHVQ01019022.1.p1  ORF type:complete len:558 (-),score=88.56 GHVQ01019022.1:746-2419(-)